MEWLLLSVLVVGLALAPLGLLAVPPFARLGPMLKASERARRELLRMERERAATIANRLERV